MRLLKRSLGPVLVLSAALGLAACESPEERAEGHYQRGMELLAAGDPERAAIEFRNVFDLNGAHSAARLEYARLVRDRGEVQEAIGQYLRLVEEDPRHAEGLKDLIDLALRVQDIDLARLHTANAFALAPEDPQVRALKAAVDYNGSTRAEAVAMAEGVLAEDPGSVTARMVLIAARLRANDAPAALELADAGITLNPDDEGLHLVRIAALELGGESEALGEALASASARFPENPGLRQALIQWHLGQGDTKSAETVLRGIALQTPDQPEGFLTVVQFLHEVDGPEASRAELESLIETQANPRPFQRALAGVNFADGQRESAIALLRSLTDGAAPSDEIRDMQVALAGMLDETGDAAGRDALIVTVLAEDAANVAALKMRARAHIEADRPEQAIQDMRTALVQEPRDPEIMTIMAFAHEREGNRELAGERFSLAFEASGHGAGEALRYARFLMQDNRSGPAESVLVNGLRRNPENRDLLMMLGQMHLERRDWARVRQIGDILRAQPDPTAQQMAVELDMASLQSQNRRDEVTQILEGLASQSGDVRAIAHLVQAHLEAGEPEAAARYLDDLRERDPHSLPLRLMESGLKAMTGDVAGAEAGYRALVAESPGMPQPHRALVALLSSTGRADEAMAALNAGLEATGDGVLMVTQAGILEQAGDFEGAIAIYEQLYALDSASPVIANNLASLLASHRADPESLERAFTIARRLRNSDVPHFQDTYGWILHLRGDTAQAIRYLEQAARALVNDPLVQFHLGEAQYSLERYDAARESFARAIELAGADTSLPQIATAQSRITAMETKAASDG